METLAGEIVEQNGYLIDAATGEVVGHAEVQEQFHPANRQEVEWVLAKLADMDTEIFAIQCRQEAYLANLDAQRKDFERRRNWLMLRFNADLEAFARTELEGQKTRTLKLDHGRLALRTIAARTALKEGQEEAAIAWAEQMGITEAVKVRKSFLISEAVKRAETLPEDLFEVVAERETFTVSTGVGK